jgi:putative two-component system response regulator
MSSYAVQLGKALYLDEGQLVLLRHGAILHDIGKIGVKETILHKPGPLTKAEWSEIKEHPAIGEVICAPLRFSHNVGPIIRHHHERWDGRGYPAALAGEQIPFLARVISVIDAFDAMTSDRPYRDALSVEEAATRLDAGAGHQWDPDITGTFLEIVKQGGPGVRRFTAVS